MSVGAAIKKSRKMAGITAIELGRQVGLSKSAISVIESDGLKNGVDPAILIRIAGVLNDITILVDHCQSCPVRQNIFLKQFPDLNNIRRDPAIIAARLGKELEEAVVAIRILGEKFSDKDFQSKPGYQEVFDREMEQVIDAKRCIETLEYELILSGIHTSRDIQRVYDNQQKKCEAHGHHHPDEDAA